MRRSIATVSLSGALDEKLPAIARAGFDGFELFDHDLITSTWSPEEVRRRAADLGLGIDLFQPFRDVEAVPQDVFTRTLRRANRVFTIMEKLGASTVLVCSNVSPHALNDDDLAAEQLHALADLAAGRGLRVAYEALAWGRHVSDYRHSWRIVQTADHPALGVCLDSFHILSRGDDPKHIEDVPGEKVFYLQLADAPRLAMDVLQWSRHYRCFPGQGGFDLQTFVGHVLATGYEGPLSLEVFNDVFRQADPDRTAVDAMRSLLALEEQVHHLPLVQRPAARLCTPAPPSELTHVAFTEVAVDKESARTVGRVLRGLGFRLVGEHRSKPVQLWQQGDVRVLLNRADPRLGDRLNADAVVTALGLESADPASSAARAETLLAPVLPRRRGREECDLSAVAAPDGTSLFFCRTGPDETSGWLADFVPLTRDEPARSPVLERVDHVGLSQPFDHFEEAVLFYRSVLGLVPQESLEFAAPDGLVRSKALRSSDGSIRVAINVSLLGRGGGRSDLEAQHVAFGCQDIFAAADALRTAGTALLPIPDNYYEDLLARTDLDPDVVERMRSYGVLHDHDETGSFLHLYTPMVGRRLFFEVVQRIGDYDGYGAANAPVRMAAQRAGA
jgi:4-hydroxyphenylpyruvate dioxygenase